MQKIFFFSDFFLNHQHQNNQRETRERRENRHFLLVFKKKKKVERSNAQPKAVSSIDAGDEVLMWPYRCLIVYIHLWVCWYCPVDEERVTQMFRNTSIGDQRFMFKMCLDEFCSPSLGTLHSFAKKNQLCHWCVSNAFDLIFFHYHAAD